MPEKKYIKNTVILFVSMAITKIVGALFKIPLANLLGGTGMGYFSTAYGLYTPVFALTGAAVPTVITRITARSLASGNPGAALSTKRIAMGLFACIGLAGSAAVAVFAEPFAEHIACSPKSTLAIICISPAVVLCCIASVVRGYYEGMSNVVPSSLAAASEAASRAVFGLAMAYAVVYYASYRFRNGLEVFGNTCSTAQQALDYALPYAAAGAVLAVSISEFFGLFTLLAADKKHSKKSSITPAACSRRRVCLMLIKETAPIAASALVINCVSFVDLLTVTRTLTASARANAEYYSRRFSSVLEASGGLSGLPNFMYGSYTGIAMSLFMLIPSFAGMTEKTAIPEITAAWTKQDRKALSESIYNLFRACSMIAAPACFGAAALGAPILSMLYPSRAAEVEVCLNSFTILCLGGIFMTIGSALFGVFQAIGKAYIPLLLMTGSVIVKLVLNPLLMSVPELNIAGAAASSAVGYILMAVGGYVFLRKNLGGSTEIGRAVCVPVMAGVLCGIAAKIAYQYAQKAFGSIVSTFLGIGTGGFVYVILLILNRFFCRSDTKDIFFKKNYKNPLQKSGK